MTCQPWERSQAIRAKEVVSKRILELRAEGMKRPEIGRQLTRENLMPVRGSKGYAATVNADLTERASYDRQAIVKLALSLREQKRSPPGRAEEESDERRKADAALCRRGSSRSGLNQAALQRGLVQLTAALGEPGESYLSLHRAPSIGFCTVRLRHPPELDQEPPEALRCGYRCPDLRLTYS